MLFGGNVSLGDSISVTLGSLLQGGRRGSQAIYKFATMEAGRLNIKYQYQIKEFSTLCMGRCKPLGSLNSFLSYAPHSLGLILFPCSPYFWQSPSSKAITLERGAGSSFCWIAILAALIHIWKPGITDSCDISCLLIRQEIFSLHMKIPLKHAPKFL